MRTLRLYADDEISESELRQALYALWTRDWTPVALAGELAAASVVGIDPRDVLATSLRSFPRPVRGGVATAGDYVIRDGVLFYVLTQRTRDPNDLFMPSSSSEAAVSRAPVEVGLVAVDSETPEALLREFADAFEQAVREAMDSERVSRVSFAWRSDAGSGGSAHGRLDGLLARLSEEGAAPRFEQPTEEPDSITNAAALADKRNRDLLVELSKVGFARESDILAGRNAPGEVQERLDELARLGLVDTEVLVQCRESSRPLIRLEDPSRLEMGEVAELLCATCSRKFADELAVPGYSLSQRCRGLVQSGRWMSVWTTRRLVEAGVPLASIRNSVDETPEEIDLLVEHLGELWVLELKDRDFEAGDAHALNYRRGRYGADKTIVVTTGEVSDDAQRAFADLAKDSNGAESDSLCPVYIEGLDAVEGALDHLFSTAGEQDALQSLQAIADATGYSLGNRVPGMPRA